MCDYGAPHDQKSETVSSGWEILGVFTVVTTPRRCTGVIKTICSSLQRIETIIQCGIVADEKL